MNAFAQEQGRGAIVLALGAEEAAILLEPAELFRAVLERNPAWRESALFLTPQGAEGGMLAVLPRPAISAWLDATATHPVEREFQELLIRHALPAELPKL